MLSSNRTVELFIDAVWPSKSKEPNSVEMWQLVEEGNIQS